MRVSLFYIKHNKTKNAYKFEEHYLKKIKKNMELQIIGITCKKKFSSKEQQMEYEGDLMRQKIKIKANETLLIPGNALHSVTKITEGVRLALITWWGNDDSRVQALHDIE